MRKIRMNTTTVRMALVCLGAIGAAGLAAGQGLDASASRLRPAHTVCAPRTTILESPRSDSQEVQAKALNDRGDIVGFADSNNGSGPIHAILWKSGKAVGAVDLGVLPGYVSSEAYGVNNNRVVLGLLYDKKKRTFPFRWEAGRMTVLKGPNGQRQEALLEQSGSHNAVNDRGEMAGTLVIAGQLRAVRWSRDGTANFLRGLPGDAWTVVKGINSNGVVSGWSRRLPKEDDENNPVIWASSDNAIAMKTAPGRADGSANATNRSGLTVGYLGNLGTDGVPGLANTDPERDNAVVWQTRSAQPLLLGRPAPVHGYSELVDVNDRGQAAAVSGSFTKTGFPLFKPAIWRTGWTSLKPLPIPAASLKSRVVIADLNDINSGGDIVGNLYGLAGADLSKLQNIDPVVWTCPFGG